MTNSLTKHLPTFVSIAQSTRVRLVVFAFGSCIAITYAGYFWERTAAEVFVSKEGHNGLFQTQVADYTYDYRGNNRHYEIWTIRIPFLVTLTLLIAFGLVTSRTLLRRNLRGLVGILWSAVILAVVALCIVTGFMWLNYSGIFI